MQLPRPIPPPYDIREWRTKPYAERLRLVCQCWALDGYGTPSAHPLGAVSVDDLDGHTFAAGSMGPKVEAACHFVRQSGHIAVIGALDDLAGILAGDNGTRISPSPQAS